MPSVATQLEPELRERAGDRDDRDLVGVANGQERAPAGRERAAGGALGLGERGREVGGARHHLARRAHLGPEHRVGAGEAREREHRGLDVVAADAALGPGSRRLASVAPAASRHAASTRFTPIAFDANGTVREARGFTSSTYTSPSAIASWTFRSPTTPSAGPEPARPRRAPRRASRRRRQHARRVARVDAGLLDVLHHRGDVRVRPVAQRVDVELDRVLEEAVDEDDRAPSATSLIAARTSSSE